MRISNLKLFIPFCLGFTLFLSFFMVFISGGNLDLYGSGSDYWDIQYFTALLTVSQILTFLLLSFIALKRPIRNHALLPLGAAGVLAIGFSLFSINAMLPEKSSVVLVAAAILLGSAIAGSMLSWLDLLSRTFGIENIAAIAAIGTSFVGVVNLALISFNDVSTTLLSLGIIAAAHFFILAGIGWNSSHRAVSTPQASKPSDPMSYAKHVRKLLGMSWRSITWVAVIGFSGGVARAMLYDSSTINQPILQIMFTMSFFVGAIVLAVFCKVSSLADGFEKLYLVLFLLAATFFFIVPFAGTEYLSMLAGIENVFVCIASICMLVTCVQIAQRNKVPVLFASGVLLSIVFGSAGFGLLFGSIVGYNLGTVIAAMIAVYVILLIGMVTAAVKAKTKQTKERVALLLTGDNAEESIRNNPVYRDVYHLSDREMDVMILAIGGRNASSISKVLFISENTVRFHLKNLYKKLDVHTKQELLSLVEGFELQ
ncbi:helix-turn-helix transcriptional regulator [Eggerthella guodeyinii]|uniref:Helix-turn-helix transcriptional regulator n=1 Tax=Eggerthella guodeyinii TaxID=2690837 RepID=A0A6L7IQR7_9ACTN|nr:helix-turn-helix transcriptional regulator [Eggerthella guodeyinii]QOS68312.1 helix-turn-helix transcriptional regulator [Eggerthella guodeyinii]